MQKQLLEELSFGLDLLNMAAHLSDDVPNADTAKLQEAVYELRTIDRTAKRSEPSRPS